MLYAFSRFSEAVEKGREAVRLLERMGDYWQVHMARYQIAASLYHLGELQGAFEESRPLEQFLGGTHRPGASHLLAVERVGQHAEGNHDARRS